MALQLISWSSSQQTVTASTVEAECMALGHAWKEMLYHRSILHELGIIELSKSTTPYGDSMNQPAQLWGFALFTATYVYNRRTNSNNHKQRPHDLLGTIYCTSTYMGMFQQNLDSRTVECLFMAYTASTTNCLFIQSFMSECVCSE